MKVSGGFGFSFFIIFGFVFFFLFWFCQILEMETTLTSGDFCQVFSQF